MTEITTTPRLTLINTFTVTSDKQAELVALLDTATAEVMRTLPGFVSANIHRSLDGKRVVNCAQWREQGRFRGDAAQPGGRRAHEEGRGAGGKIRAGAL